MDNPAQPPKPTDTSGASPEPGSAPAVPKELLSARPAMSRVVPQSPDKLAAASRATNPAPVVSKISPEELEERQTRVDYLKTLRGAADDEEHPPRKPKRSKTGGKKWLWIIIALLLLAAAAGTTYYVLMPAKSDQHRSSASKATTQSAPTTQTQSGNNTTAQLADKKYDSTNFALSLMYPSSWKLADSTTKLTILSPSMQLTTAGGKQATAGVLVTIRSKQTELPEFKQGNATAVLQSQKLAYTSPAAGQRASTYLSFLQYASTTTKGALDAAYITGNAGYQKAQNVPQTDVVKVDPLISVSFVDCSASCTVDSPALSIASSDWGGSLKTTVESILTSLVIN